MGKYVMLLAVAVVLATPLLAAAVDRGGVLSVSPVIGGISYESSQHLESAPLFGTRFGYMITGRIGVEALFDYSRTALVSTKNLLDSYRYGGELLYHFMPDNKLVPYIAGGYGGINFKGKSTFADTEKTKGSPGYGFGAKYFATEDMAWRADVRHIMYSYNKLQHAIEYTIGVYIPFGGAPQALKLADPPPPPPPAPPRSGKLAPGVYVQVLEGVINLSNQAGDQNISADQFGYSASTNKVPILLTADPGIPFNPPPSIPLTGATGQTGTGETGMPPSTEP